MNNINSLHPAISIIAGDFNGKCSKWYSLDASDNIGKELDTITLTARYSQIIDIPTHFTNNSKWYSLDASDNIGKEHFTNNSSPCTELIFTSNSSIIVD